MIEKKETLLSCVARVARTSIEIFGNIFHVAAASGVRPEKLCGWREYEKME